MKIEITESQAKIIIKALRYQYDGCGDVPEEYDEENNKVADYIKESLVDSGVPRTEVWGL